MIYEKKWVKKEKEVSIKSKNYFFKTHLEARTIVYFIILMEVQIFEEQQRDSKITAVREKASKLLQELAAIEQLEREQKAAEASLLATDEQQPIVEVPDYLKDSTGERLTSEQILEQAAIDEALINKEHELKLRFLRRVEMKNLLIMYPELFVNFQIHDKILGVIAQYSLVDELVDLKFLESTSLRNALTFDPKSYLVNPSSSQIDNILFFSRLHAICLRNFEKTLKLRRKKWRFKKRKLRKLYKLRKMRRAAIFKKFRKKSHKFHQMTQTFATQYMLGGSNLLVRRMPLSERVIIATNLEFFYKLNKKLNEEFFGLVAGVDAPNFEPLSDFLIYLRNYHQKPYLKLRKARLAHWKLFWNKTIRKQRYGGFLNKFMHNYHKLSYSYTYFVNFFTKFNFSWSKTNKLESFCKTNLVQNYSNMIIRVPLFFSNYIKWKILKRRDYRLRKKVGRWSYLNFKRATQPWLQRKKHSPKIANHIQPKMQYLNMISQFDSMTGYIHISTPLLQHMFPVVDEFKVNFLLRLHMYRYKANIKCTWHSLIQFICEVIETSSVQDQPLIF